MTKTLPFSLLAAAALASGGLAYAQAPAAKATTATHAVMTKKTTTATAGKPAATAARTRTTTRTASNNAGGRMVATKTSTGKAITYNCSKAGNAGKKACKS